LVSMLQIWPTPWPGHTTWSPRLNMKTPKSKNADYLLVITHSPVASHYLCKNYIFFSNLETFKEVIEGKIFRV
jgi:hypothetical protein